MPLIKMLMLPHFLPIFFDLFWRLSLPSSYRIAVAVFLNQSCRTAIRNSQGYIVFCADCLSCFTVLRRLPAHMSTYQSCSTHRAEIDIEAIHKTGVIFIENLDISAPLQTDKNSRFCLSHNVQIFSRCSVRITAKFATAHAYSSFGGCGSGIQ